jgi:glycosyltransferase involved in cell wall biosynthesis
MVTGVTEGFTRRLEINGVGYLVDVAAAMRTVAPEVRFLLVGQGAETEKISVQAQEAGVLHHNLWIWKSIPKQEMPDLLAAATVATSLFIPLRPMWNNSANKFFDALAAGKPIAINYGGWQAELLERSGAGLVMPPNDPMQAAQLLASFIHDPQRLRRAGAAAHTLAHTEFHRDTMAAKLETVLTQAVEAHQRGKPPVPQSR